MLGVHVAKHQCLDMVMVKVMKSGCAAMPKKPYRGIVSIKKIFNFRQANHKHAAGDVSHKKQEIVLTPSGRPRLKCGINPRK